jgi:chemotaxis protein MotB
MDEEEDDKRGTPAWVMTFADLMSLLMCFFVLLLSFAEMDAIRFKEIATEMASAFGVQRDVPAFEPPMGTSPIFDKFSPGVPQPTPVDSVRQQTTQDAPQLRTFTSDARVEEAVERRMESSVEELREVLEDQISQGLMQLERDRERIVIRIEERGSFPSGSADMSTGLAALLGSIADVLADMPGMLTVEGHTDNVPIRTARFRSNWDLSAARAASVANALLDKQVLQATRLSVQGYAETRPRADNATAEGRALNRRVEIIIDLAEPLQDLQSKALELIGQGRDDLIMNLQW